MSLRLRLSEIAELCQATLEGDGERSVTGPAPLEEAGPGEISFFDNPRYRSELESTRATAVLVGEDVRIDGPGPALLRCSDPGQAFSRVILAFCPPEPPAAPGVHPAALVEEGVELGAGVSIGAFCYVAAGARLESDVVLHPRVHVGADAHVGAGSQLHPGVVLYPRVRVGARCILHAGAVIGADGFGFDPTPTGWEKIPQCGDVVLEDNVEVGANCTIDRARFGSTRIGCGVKLDNLVHVAHNVRIGEAALLVAQSGVAGSTTLGKRVILAGQAGVAGHLELGAGARVGGGSAVFKDVAPGQDVFGVPAGPKAQVLRVQARQRRLDSMAAELRELARRLAALEEQSP